MFKTRREILCYMLGVFEGPISAIRAQQALRFWVEPVNEDRAGDWNEQQIAATELELALRLVDCGSKSWVRVRDLMGSGTVALSCARNGRSVIGGDLGARETDGRRWADIARENADAVANPAQRSMFA